MQDKSNAHANFSARLLRAMGERGLNQSALAARLGTKQSTVRTWLVRSLPSRLLLPQLAQALSVRTQWLSSGEGPMEREHEAVASGGSETGTNPQPVTPLEFHSVCTTLLRDLWSADSRDQFEHAVGAFEFVWEKYKAARRAALTEDEKAASFKT